MKVYRISRLAAFCVCVFPSLGYAEATNVTTAPVERLRQIPEDAHKGVMWWLQGPFVKINDEVMRRAPGAIIRDMNNRIVLPNTVRRPKKIRYTLDMYGQVRKIWISPTGEYIGRHLPAEPPGGRRDEPIYESTDDSTGGSKDDSKDDSADDSTEDSKDSPDA